VPWSTSDVSCTSGGPEPEKRKHDGDGWIGEKGKADKPRRAREKSCEIRRPGASAKGLLG
jgi:hypothetical protein